MPEDHCDLVPHSTESVLPWGILSAMVVVVLSQRFRKSPFLVTHLLRERISQILKLEEGERLKVKNAPCIHAFLGRIDRDV